MHPKTFYWRILGLYVSKINYMLSSLTEWEITRAAVSYENVEKDKRVKSVHRAPSAGVTNNYMTETTDPGTIFFMFNLGKHAFSLLFGWITKM